MAAGPQGSEIGIAKGVINANVPLTVQSKRQIEITQNDTKHQIITPTYSFFRKYYCKITYLLKINKRLNI